MKKVVILGSTGSVGKQTLSVIRKNPKDFKVLALTGYKNTRLLKKQLKEFNAKTGDPCELATLKEADLIVNAISGCAGIEPTLNAVKAGKVIALANKESLVSKGAQIIKTAKRTGAKIIPVDSEHSAIFQILQGYKMPKVKRIILTCSGGPFLGRKSLKGVTKAQALKHPTWKMGPKITIDCATLMNKGLEIIEAKHLFKLPAEKIGVVIHPESQIHGIVEFKNGEILAYTSKNDMKILIEYALYYPKTRKLKYEIQPLKDLKYKLQEPDLKTFPLLRLAMDIAKKGDKEAAKMNKANENAVKKFLNDEIKFEEISKLVIRKTTTTMNIAVILAGGKSSRMGTDKLSLKARGKTVLEHTIKKFKGYEIIIATGGKTRQETLKKALKNLKGNPLIIVHNAANPLVAEKEIRECVKAAKINGAAYVGHRVADTIHDKNGKTYTRENLIAAQTPQVAYLKDLKKALAPGIEYTDEVQLLEQIGIKAKFVPASKNNFKITTWQDFEYFKYLLGEKITGLGEDTHGFSKEKGLMLGGAKFPKEYKTTANSDGDVILHSLTNAIKSALGLKSLGATADKMFKAGIRDSKKYLKEVLKNLKKKELKITSISISVETNSPKIDPISGKIKQSLRKLTGCKNVGLTALTGNRKTNQIRTTSIVNLTNED